MAPEPRVTEFFRGKRIYIADGHHRFQTAATYRDLRRGQGDCAPDAPHQFVLMGLVALEDPGLAIYAPHRLAPLPAGFDEARVAGALAEHFDVRTAQGALPDAVAAAPGACVLGLAVTGGGEYVLRLRDGAREALLGNDRGPAWRDLDVAVLHRGILEGILGMPEDTEFIYEKSAARALDAVGKGESGLAFILRPARPGQIRACAEAGERMPQKSTYFFPKLPSGAVIHRLA